VKEVVQVYTKPTLDRFGAVRELTLLGFANASDGFSVLGISSPGCATPIVGSIGCSGS
jgi:hypothetical protein